MASANDLIVLFLGLEILSIALYVLAGMPPAAGSQSQEAAIKYFVLGGFSSAFFLYGIALVYGATGSTNLVEDRRLPGRQRPLDQQRRCCSAGMALLLVGFGFKVAAVPFHSWTPDVYQGSPTPVTGVHGLGREGGRLRRPAAGVRRRPSPSYRLDWQPVIYVLAVLTLLVGSILAVVQTDVKRMLAYSSISHAGFILVGVAGGERPRRRRRALFYLARLHVHGARQLRRGHARRPHGRRRDRLARRLPRPRHADARCWPSSSRCSCSPRPACRSRRASSPSST